MPKKQAERDSLIDVLDSSPTGVAISSLDGDLVLYANQAMASFFGITREQAVGRPASAYFVDSEDRRKVRAALAKGGEVRKYKVRNRTPEGPERLSMLSCRLTTYAGEPAILTWIEDETEYEKREQDVASATQQVEMLRQIAGICNRAVNFYDALRKGSGEIARCLDWPVSVVYRRNYDDAKLLELSSMALPKDRSDLEFLRAALVGRSFRIGEDLPGRVLESRETVWIEDVNADKRAGRFVSDADVRVVSALGIPIVAEDAVVAVLELLSDKLVPRDERVVLTLAQVSAELSRVHLRDQTTVALQEARAEAESSARAKASFLAAMSHEVRTPMNGVVGMVDLVLRTKLDDDQRFMLQTVKESGRALIKVINDILDFSKIEAGRLEIEQAAFSVTKTVEAVGMSLGPTAAKKKLSLITYVDPAVPDTLIGDPVRVHQILSNLGSNAVKFSAAGEVVIKAELAAPDDQGGAPGPAKVRFSVRDEGIGIAADALERLFEEFQQADTSTTRRFGGTGLGLAICQRLTSLMGGSIAVESVLGVGSEFSCELPFALPERAAEDTGTTDLQGLRVMVVAESQELRDAARGYIAFWKADVTTVTRLRECIPVLRTAIADNAPIDVLVLPQASDARQVAALRKGFIDVGMGVQAPRIVLGRDPQVAEPDGVDLVDVTRVDVNPVRRTALITAVAVAAGRASPETSAVEEPEHAIDIAPPTIADALTQGRLILVAEDHVANQDVLRRQLNRLGYACEIAEDGAVALRMWKAKKYALLLTDCHMPNMDGFGLTAEIRNAEKGTGVHAPIVAITANVLQGEAERCLAAGMDAFLPKPVEFATLRAALAKWMGVARADAASAAAAPPQVSSDTHPVLDLGRVIDAFGQIDDDVREYFGLFLRSVLPLISQFEDELAGARFKAARETIHKARGATANAGGRELAAVMHDIEAALVAEKIDEARGRSGDVRPAWERLTQAIAQI